MYRLSSPGGDEDYGESVALSLDSSYLLSSDSEDEGSFFESDFLNMTPEESPLPKELELRAGSQPLKYALWTRVELTRGKRFGPIPAQLKDSEPTRPTAWKVRPGEMLTVSVLNFYFSI